MKRRVATVLLIIAVALVATATVMAHGIPSFRHDWIWPVSRTPFLTSLYESMSGWTSNGLGEANAVPTTYLIEIVFAVAGILLGPQAALIVVLVVLFSAIAVGALRVAESSAFPIQFGAVTFATMNPWVYNEVVAGHLAMIIAYAATIILLSELMKPEPQSELVGLCVCVSVCQLQFAIINLAVVGAIAIIRRRRLAPWLSLLVVFAPIVVGLVSGTSTLERIPYLVQWQRSGAVPFSQALQLLGYFPHYEVAFHGPAALLSLIVVDLIALTALICGARADRVWGIAVLVLAAVVSAPLWLFGPAYSYLIEHARFTALYREEYDLVGFLAIALLFLSTTACRRVIPLGYLFAGASLAIGFCWVALPPASFWPRYPADPIGGVPPGFRFAMIPAFQPLRLAGEGSGIAPWLFHGGWSSPAINTYSISLPQAIALAIYEQSGNAALLRPFGVSRIFRLEETESADGSKAQTAGSGQAARKAVVSELVPNPMPLLTAAASLPSTSLGTEPTCCGQVFFGDAREASALDFRLPWTHDPPVTFVRAQSATLDASSAWIDGTLLRPDLAHFVWEAGNVFTTSSVPLTLPANTRRFVLANTDGLLRDAQGTLMTQTSGFQWSPRPAQGALFCEGRCAVAALASELPRGKVNAVSLKNVDVHEVTPWLYVAWRLPIGSHFLRFNVSYDRGWAAVDKGGILPHFRVDLYANGWFDSGSSRSPIVFVQLPSLLILILEAAGVCAFIRIAIAFRANHGAVRNR